MVQWDTQASAVLRATLVQMEDPEYLVRWASQAPKVSRELVSKVKKVNPVRWLCQIFYSLVMDLMAGLKETETHKLALNLPTWTC